MLINNLGTLIAVTSGDGLYSNVRKTVALSLTCEVDISTIERNRRGVIEFAVCRFSASFSSTLWDSTVLGHMYTDSGIVKAINLYLKSLGFSGKVDWSEQGKQENGVADFDMDYRLIDQNWPELRRAA